MRQEMTGLYYHNKRENAKTLTIDPHTAAGKDQPAISHAASNLSFTPVRRHYRKVQHSCSAIHSRYQPVIVQWFHAVSWLKVKLELRWVIDTCQAVGNYTSECQWFADCGINCSRQQYCKDNNNATLTRYRLGRGKMICPPLMAVRSKNHHGSMSVCIWVRSPHISVGRRWLSCRQPVYV